MPSLVFGVEMIQVIMNATDSSELTIPLPRKDSWARQKVMMKILSSNLFFMWGTREVSISLPKPNLKTISAPKYKIFTSNNLTLARPVARIAVH
jgi:hypothetical protein